MTFLTVDDSSTIRKIVGLALRGAGHTVLEAENGRVALETLAKSPVDCVVLDINMPEMNGVEFLKARKANPALAKVAVIVLTTQDEGPLKEEALAHGANAFLVKPFQKEALMATIKAVVG